MIDFRIERVAAFGVAALVYRAEVVRVFSGNAVRMNLCLKAF